MSTADQRARRDVFLAAQESVFNGRDKFSCIAVGRFAPYSPGGSMREDYKNMFHPLEAQDRDNRAAWPSEDLEFRLSPDHVRRGWRLTALAFAAAMAETGDL